VRGPEAAWTGAEYDGLCGADSAGDQALDELQALLSEGLSEACRGEVIKGSISKLAEQTLQAEQKG